MRQFLTLLALAVVPFALVAEEEKTTEPAAAEQKPMSLVEEGSYLVGVDMGMRLEQGISQLSLDKELVIQGISDYLDKKPLKSNHGERFQLVFHELVKVAKQKMAEQGKENEAKGKAYMESLKGKDGMNFTASGMAYEVLTAGEGDQITPADTVNVHYRGTLMNGKVFDSSYKRGKPFPVDIPQGRVIKGWLEALPLMKVGSKFRFHIPSNLGYGPQGTGSIPPNSVLIFEIEALEIVKK